MEVLTKGGNLYFRRVNSHKTYQVKPSSFIPKTEGVAVSKRPYTTIVRKRRSDAAQYLWAARKRIYETGRRFNGYERELGLPASDGYVRRVKEMAVMLMTGHRWLLRSFFFKAIDSNRSVSSLLRNRLRK